MGYVYGGETHNCELPSNERPIVKGVGVVSDGSIWECDECKTLYYANRWGVPLGPKEYFTWQVISKARAANIMMKKSYDNPLGFVMKEE